MIACAKRMEHPPAMGTVEFQAGDVLNLPFDVGVFDTVITQRLLINMASRENQRLALSEIARVLRPGGRYLMMEQSMQGWENLNTMRAKFGLPEIPAADAKTNWFNIKFDDDELKAMVAPAFDFVKSQRFGMYFFLSRVIHPLLVAPENPKYDAKINEIARKAAFEVPNYEDLGHMILYVLKKR